MHVFSQNAVNTAFRIRCVAKVSQIPVFLLRLLFWVLHKHQKYHGFGSILGLGSSFCGAGKLTISCPTNIVINSVNTMG